VARRLEDTRRSARLRGPNGRSLPGSLPGTRECAPSCDINPDKTSCTLGGLRKPHLLHLLLAGHSTPQRSRSASRDPSAVRSQHHGRSAECRGAWVDPQGRGPVPRLTERLRAAVRTTPAAQPAIPARQQRSASPGRALLEVRQRLQQYVGAQAGRTSSLPAGQREATDGRQAASSQQQQHFRLLGASQAAAPRPHAPPSGGRHADASAEIADIDSRLQSLQSFLRAAKAGQAPAARA
jgi:coiled-coil domain-containing protein 61